AILAAILFPVFAQAREKARGISCLSNCKQIGTGIMMYSQDYDETLVSWVLPTGQPRNGTARGNTTTWGEELQPYIKNGQYDRIAGLAPTAQIPPKGLMACPSWNPNTFSQSMDAPDCDGADAHVGWIPATQYYANYGIGFGVDCRTAGACDPSGC